MCPRSAEGLLSLTHSTRLDTMLGSQAYSYIDPPHPFTCFIKPQVRIPYG